MSITVDQILQRMIVDARNYNPNIVISQGTETYIRFATAASAVWGLYKQIDWTLDQIFPPTMNQESLEQWANDRGLNYENLTASELLTLILSYLRNPRSGFASYHQLFLQNLFHPFFLLYYFEYYFDIIFLCFFLL